MRIINRFQSRVSELPGSVTYARTVRAGQNSPPIVSPSMSFEHAYMQPGGDPVDALAYAYQYMAQNVMDDVAAPASSPALGRLYSGSAVREASVRGTARLGAFNLLTPEQTRELVTSNLLPPNALPPGAPPPQDTQTWAPTENAPAQNLSAPWYENPVYLGVGGIAVLAGVWWLSGRKR